MKRQFWRMMALILTMGMLLGGCRGIFEKKREAVRELTCTTPAILSGMQALTDGKAVLCQIDYAVERTTVQVVDTAADEVSAACFSAGIEVRELAQQERDIEEYFVELMGGADGEKDGGAR